MVPLSKHVLRSALLIALNAAYWPGSFASQPPPDFSESIALAGHVREALSAAPFLQDHVEVSTHGGDIILRGFVYSDWDLMDTLRIARTAAAPHRIIDDLSIEEGGRR
jgi:hypothetical protein